jgi:hypothetical protein
VGIFMQNIIIKIATDMVLGIMQEGIYASKYCLIKPICFTAEFTEVLI